MTSMFDQYNTALKREDGPSRQIVSATLPSSGFVSVRTTEETPIFSKRKMPINLPQDILFTRVCNNWLVVLMSHNVLLRLYLQQTDRQDGNFQLHKLYANESSIDFLCIFRGFLRKISNRVASVKYFS